MNPYSLLSHLPLFQGMSSSEFDEIIAHTRLGFSKVAKGECIVHEGKNVAELIFVLKGEAEAQTYSDDRGFNVVEKNSVRPAGVTDDPAARRLRQYGGG